MIRRIVEEMAPIVGLAPVLPSSAVPDAVALKNYGRVSVFIIAKNATTVTGAVITAKQAKDVAGTDEKALAFDKVWLNNDVAASGARTETAVVSNTFTLDNTNSKDILAVMEINTESLDVNNGFNTFSIDVADAVAQTVSVLYILHDARYADTLTDNPIVD